MGRLLGRLCVGFTTCLIAFISYSSQIFVIWPWYGRVLSVDLIVLLLPFNILVALLYWNYLLTVRTDPGSVPKLWRPDTLSEEGYEVKRLTGNLRFCRTCNVYKPPRAHHCRQCRRCVLRMDHHCPWVNNCVGYFNHGHFIRFLFYVDLACSYHMVMIIRRTYQAMNGSYWEGPDIMEFIFIILNYVTCVPVLLAVGGFSVYHFYCLVNNSTTIEGWEKDKVATLVKRGKIHEVKFPYNVGYRENIASVLGSNLLLWCCPTVPPGDGLSFKVIQADGESAQSWPPQDPTKFRMHSDYHKSDESVFNDLADDGPYDDDTRVNHLPGSPWTYANGTLNPALEPSNAYRRASKASQAKESEREKSALPGISKGEHGSRSTRVYYSPSASAVPPYHPDFASSQGLPMSRYPGSGSEYDDGGDSDMERYGPGARVRRGSEGYEVQQVADREEILRRYILSRGQEAGRYNLYAPSPPSDPEPNSSQSEEECEEDDGSRLRKRLNRSRECNRVSEDTTIAPKMEGNVEIPSQH